MVFTKLFNVDVCMESEYVVEQFDQTVWKSRYGLVFNTANNPPVSRNILLYCRPYSRVILNLAESVTALACEFVYSYPGLP